MEALRSLLAHYCEKGDLAGVERLLAEGADPNERGDCDWSCLRWAMEKAPNEVIVARLLTAGVDIAKSGDSNWTIQQNARNKGYMGIHAMLYDDFAKRFAECITDHRISDKIKNFTPGRELDIALRDIYVNARKDWSDEQKKEAFRLALGESLRAEFMRAPDDYDKATDPEERRHHVSMACAGTTFPVLLHNCVKSDAKSGSHTAIDEALSYLTPYWREQYQNVIGAAEAKLARTSILSAEAKNSSLAGFIRN